MLLNFDDCLISDADIAKSLSVSKSWVRKERFNRRRQLPHVLDIDPVRVGSLPRYRATEYRDWLKRLGRSSSGETEAQHVFA